MHADGPSELKKLSVPLLKLVLRAVDFGMNCISIDPDDAAEGTIRQASLWIVLRPNDRFALSNMLGSRPQIGLFLEY